MTTIAYNHKDKQIAVESFSTMDGVIVNRNATKHFNVGGDIYFVAGKTNGLAKFIIAHKHGEKVDPNIADCAAFVIKEDGTCWLFVIDENWLPQSCILDYDSAMGSGENFALAAMDMGKSAGEAVEYACTRDCYSGGKVTIYDIERKEFI